MSLRLLAAVGVSVLAAAGAQAQEYPSRPITLVLPFAAGSGIDPTARLVGDELGRALKQPVVIDYKPGANGAIAASAVARRLHPVHDHGEHAFGQSEPAQEHPL